MIDSQHFLDLEGWHCHRFSQIKEIAVCKQIHEECKEQTFWSKVQCAALGVFALIGVIFSYRITSTVFVSLREKGFSLLSYGFSLPVLGFSMLPLVLIASVMGRLYHFSQHNEREAAKALERMYRM